MTLRLSRNRRIKGEKPITKDYLSHLQRSTEQMFLRLNKKGERLINLEKKPTQFRQFPAYLWHFQFVSKDKVRDTTVFTFVRNGEFYMSSFSVASKKPDAQTLAAARQTWMTMMNGLQDVKS